MYTKTEGGKSTLNSYKAPLCYIFKVLDPSIGESRWVVGCTSRLESTLRYRGESGRLRRQEIFMGYNWLLNGIISRRKHIFIYNKLSGRFLRERKTYTKMDQIRFFYSGPKIWSESNLWQRFCFGMVSTTCLSLSMRGTYNNEIAE